jgi:ubiquitin C-terminal hydrolase
MKIPVFPNLGNTCYINSVLQCLVYNDKLKQLKLDTPLFTEFHKITEIVDKTENGQYLAVFYNLNNFISNLPFKRFEQQDAHEFILYMLDKFDPKQLFYGKTRTNIHCLNCENETNISEDFSSINLNININLNFNCGKSDEPVQNITDLMVKYFEREIHTNKENLYFCEKCNSLNPYCKKIILETLPETLVIVLKRYTATGQKIISEVEIDKVLKIKESSTGEIKVYNLVSSINHAGNLYNGHYTSFINVCNKWNSIHASITTVKELPIIIIGISSGSSIFVLFKSSSKYSLSLCC